MRPSLYEQALIDNIITTEDGEYISILDWIKQNINTSPYKKIVVDAAYMKEILGPEFRKKNKVTICASIKHILRKHNIKLRESLDIDGNIRMTMTFF